MLTGKYRKGDKGRAEGFGGRVFQPENSAQRTSILDTVLAVAGECDASADQVAIAWASTHGGVPIIGPRSLGQLTSNLGALSLELSIEQISRLDAVSSLNPPAAARKLVSWGTDEKTSRIVA